MKVTMAASNAIKSAATAGWRGALRKWTFTSAGYNQYGLLHDDIIDDMLPEVKEAIRRLPKNVAEERQFRMSRALYLSMRKEILPQNEWTNFEEDVRYLQPLVDEVKREILEKQQWNKK